MSGPANPINTPLWFIRDLMVLVILSPVIWWLIRKVKILFVLILGIVWFFSIGEFFCLPNLCHQSLFFFPLGAYFGINKLNFVEMSQRLYWIPFVYIIIAMSDSLFRETHGYYIIHNVEIIVGMVTFVNIAGRLIKNDVVHTKSLLFGASFFVYALHNLFLGKMTKIVVMFIHPNLPITVLLVYFSMPLIAIAICLYVYKIIYRYMPTLCSIITGGR